MISIKVSQNKQKMLEQITKPLVNKSDIMMIISFLIRFFVMYNIIKITIMAVCKTFDGFLGFGIFVLLIIFEFKIYRYLRHTHHISYLNDIVVLKSNKIVRLVDVIDVDKTIQNMENNKLKYVYLNIDRRDIEVFEKDKYFKSLKEYDKYYIAYQYLKSDKWSKEHFNDLVKSLESLSKQNEIAQYKKTMERNSSKIKKYHRLYERSNIDHTNETIKKLIDSKNKLM